MTDMRQGVSDGAHTVLDLVDALRDFRGKWGDDALNFTARGLLANAGDFIRYAEGRHCLDATTRHDIANAAARLILCLDAMDAEEADAERRASETQMAQAVDDILSTAVELGGASAKLLTLTEGTAPYIEQADYCGELVERINSRARRADMTGAELLAKAEGRLKGQMPKVDVLYISMPCAAFAGAR